MTISTVTKISFIWTGKNKEAFIAFINKSKNENYQILDGENKCDNKYLLYIDSLGGFIDDNTELFILEESIYLQRKIPL